jgi:hypothetical protein
MTVTAEGVVGDKQNHFETTYERAVIEVNLSVTIPNEKRLASNA